MNTTEHRSGYRVEKIYVAEQTYRIAAETDITAIEPAGDRQVMFGWDWRPIAPRRFEVVITVQVDPTKGSPETAMVRLIGVFSAEKGELSISFADFLRENAPAILFPYAREVISTMTSRGPFGAFHLNPINVRSLLSGVDISLSTGHRHLTEHTEIARSFELLASSVESTAPTT